MKENRIEKTDFSSCISGKVNRIARVTSSIFRKHLSPHNITESQLSILFVISKKEKITQKLLSDFLLLEKSTVNRGIKRLIKNKYLSESELPLLVITEAGIMFVNQVVPSWQKAMDEISELLKDDGIEEINSVLNKLTRNS